MTLYCTYTWTKIVIRRVIKAKIEKRREKSTMTTSVCIHCAYTIFLGRATRKTTRGKNDIKPNSQSTI